MKKKLKKNIFLVLLIVIGSLLCAYGFTLAKYVSNHVWDYYFKSKGFYFSSDYLGSTTIKNVDNQWNGGSVNFNIKNNLNQTVITNYDIGYSATCTIIGDASSYTECHMNGTESNTQEGVLSSFQTCVNNTGDQVDVSLFNKTDCELGGYDWVNQVAIKDLYFDVVLTNGSYELTDVVVNVAVTSTYPYRKTLNGNFTLHKNNINENSVTLNYKNYSDYGRLIVSNSYSSNKCVKVTWDPNKLLINADNSEFSSYLTDLNGYINEIKFNIGAKGTLNYIFYKRNFDITYDVTEFLIEESSGC
jgi:hypothetical protein